MKLLAIILATIDQEKLQQGIKQHQMKMKSTLVHCNQMKSTLVATPPFQIISGYCHGGKRLREM